MHRKVEGGVSMPRLAVGVGVLVMMLAGLLGCSTESSTDSADNSSSEEASQAADSRPQEGDCWWQEDYREAADWRSWEGAGPVDCASEPHNSITYRVEDLPKRIIDRPEDTSALPAEVWFAVEAICKAEKLSLEYADAQLSRVSVSFYLPTAEEWSAGERWVRCDMGMRRIGSTWAYQRRGSFEELPPTIDKIPRRLSSAGNQLCTKGTKSPLDPKAIIADCYLDIAKVHWKFLWQPRLKGGPDAPFPGTDVVRAFAARKCGSDNTDTMWYSPTEENWASGLRTVTCFEDPNSWDGTW